MELWKGYCGTHALITSEAIDKLRGEHPKAEFIMHPECGCTTKSMHLADQVLSTEAMVKYTGVSPCKEFIVATEVGILHRMKQHNPEKKFYPASEQAVCRYMKLNTLEKLVLSLERMEYEIRVPKPLAEKALLPIQRMLSISENP